MAKPKTNFSSVGAGIINRTEQAAQESARGRVTTFELDANLDQRLERVTFWGGPKQTKRSVINTALAYYFENDPTAKENASKPYPGEE